MVATFFNTAFFVLLTNALSPAEVGLFSLLNIIVLAVGTVSILGSPMVGAGLASPPAVVRFLAQYLADGRGRAAKRMILMSLSISAVVSIFFAALLFLPWVSKNLSHPFGTEPVLYAAFDGVFFSLGQISAFSLVGVGRAGRAGLLVGASAVVKYVVASLLLYLGLGVPGVFVGFSVGDLLLLVSSLALVFGSVPHQGDSRIDRRALAGYMPSVLASSVLGLAIAQTGKLLAFSSGSFSDLAVFNVAWVAAMVAGQAPIALTNSLVPTLVSLRAGDVARRREVVANLTRYVSLVTLPIGFWLAATSPLLPSLFGAGYASATPLIAIMSASVSLTAVMSVYSSELLVGRRTSLFLLGNVLGLATLLLGSYLLAPRIGLLGIAVGRALMLLASLVAFSVFVKSSREFVIDLPGCLKALAGAGLMMAAVSAAEFIFAPSLHTRLEDVAFSVATVPFAALVYVVSLRLLGAFREDDFRLLERVLPKPVARLADLAREVLL